MNIKLQLSEVRLLIDSRLHIEQISSQLQPIAQQANLVFAEHQVGAGYLQWSLPGSDWVAFPNGSDEQKAVIAQAYKDRKAQMQTSLQGSLLKDIVFSVPSEDFIYFRQTGGAWEIALTAWGYKYPDRPASRELDTWIRKQDLQEVNIAFAWDGQTLPGINFKLSGYTRTTSPDGFMHVDQQLPVGSSYPIETLTGRSFTLFVEKGKADYIFDLTQYCMVDVAVQKDHMPHPDCVCEIDFGGNHRTIKTDQSGRAVERIPLLNDLLGQAVIPQPPCVVACGGETQQQVPSASDGALLSFVFNFDTPVVEEPLVDDDVVVVARTHPIKVEVFRGGEPVQGQTSEIMFDGESHTVTTDEKGEVFYEILLHDGALELLSDEASMCEVVCEDIHQRKSLRENDAVLVFRFDLPVPEEPQEPELVYIQLKDYAGMPLVDMPFELTTKKKGKVQLQTDSEGQCIVPKEWFTPKEKMKIDFTVSVEYQQTHDLHDKRNKDKK